ncbi:hypothetical protein AB4Z21_04645 [Paenibacillus sp. MCAF20]
MEEVIHMGDKAVNADWTRLGVPEIYKNTEGRVIMVVDGKTIEMTVQRNSLEPTLSEPVSPLAYYDINFKSIGAATPYPNLAAYEGIKLISADAPPSAVAMSTNHYKHLEDIVLYIHSELTNAVARGEDGLAEAKIDIAYNAGQVLLKRDLDDYTPKMLNAIFEPLGVTFKEVEEWIRRDSDWQEW